MFYLVALLYLCNISKAQLSCKNGLNDKDFDGEVVDRSLFEERYSELRSEHFAFPQDPLSYSPDYIIVPSSDQDIQQTISFAKECGFKIVI